MVSSSISTVLMTGFIALASSSSVNAESMTTPLNYGVYSSATCTGETIDQGTTKYLAPLPAAGSFCESSITSVDNGEGTMVMAEIYTKINVVNCAAFPLSGEVSVEVFLCYDKNCGSCKDSEEGAEAISASLILPEYGTSYPKQDACWGISSTYSTSYQKFAGDTMDLAEGRMDGEGDDNAITAYWRIFADNSCIGPSVGAEKMAVEETAVAEPTVEEIIETETVTGTAKAAESGSASVLATTTTVAAAMMMMLVLVGSL
mmetsp:Transcript_33103/g.37598  ORF Transcript_33103/g.37598 Transcript_33103/m.37598 type:complete len:260 (+) Transcript_33103:151-930(+)|eukprot:CAMPEP_0170810526 /NCGR_PEP_ID=MMETSP0733-20121128/34700_1 /TAXON_ID=186038 /ORGANISM="Fragilariopsis kerguelensis, Strain L26-C5" /LENGTH=259 /DNA_ID=CAMNT_0011166479 /DNA_START=141 /DNA_END=920 /DNA_ORIENTATION=+